MGEAEKKQHDNLLRAARDDGDVLDFAQKRYKEAVQLMVGQHYSRNGSPNPVPDNKLALLQIVLHPILAGQKPAVDVTTTERGLEPTAFGFKLAFPELLDDVDYEEMSRACLASSLLSPFATCEVGRELVKTVETDDGDKVKVTHLFAKEVQFEDFRFDTQAKRWSDTQYQASREDVQFEKFMDENTDLDDETRDALSAAQKGSEGDDGESRVSDIGRGKTAHRGQYLETMTIWKFWCRDSGTIKLFNDLNDGIFIKDLPYTGPKNGPYHRLHYHDVPGQTIPLSPAAILRDVIEAINMGWNKAFAQAEAQKSVYGFRDAELATLIQNLADGGTYQSHQPEIIRTDIGGPHQSNIGIAQIANNIFEQSGYPLSLLGGLGAGSPTATQDAILQGNAGRLIAQMAYRKYAFDQSICEHLASEIWDDEMFDPDLEYRPPGYRGSPFKISFAPEARMGKFPKYKIRVVPFSSAVHSPEEQWENFKRLIMEVIIPGGPMMAQQGIQVDWAKFIRGYAESKGFDAPVRDAILFSATRPQPDGDAPGKPAATTRKYERISKSSGQNPQARAMDMANMLMAPKNQGGQQGGAY